MDKNTLKSTFFFSLGCYSLFMWNSIVNLNDFFVNSFDNQNISKIYTFSYFIFCLVSIPTTYYLDKKVNIFKTLTITSILMIICFNLLYFFCRYCPISPLKYVIFIILISSISFSVLIYNSLGTALSSRFHDNEMSLNFQGKAFAGLFCNLIMFIAIISSNTTDSNEIFKVYLIIGDIFIVIYFIFIKRNFFTKCINNEYKKIRDEEEEALMKNRRMSEDDMGKNFSSSTLSFGEIFGNIYDLVFCMMITMGSTIASFPVLNFKLDFNLPPYIVYSVITLIFNLADVLSRFIIGYKQFKIDKIIYAYIFLVIKVVLIYFTYLCIYNKAAFYQSIITKTILVFLQGFLNGYLCLFFVERIANRFTNIHNRNRAGYFTSFSIMIGLTIGSVISLFWV